MKTLTVLLQTKKNAEKEIQKKTKPGKLFKIVLGIFMLSWMLFISSCLVGPPRYGGPSGHPGNHENRGNNGNNGHHGDHDNDDPHHK
jgi:hypothetical protein